MDAVALLGQAIKKTAELTRDNDGLGCAKYRGLCHAVEDNPFMAGAFHGPGEGDAAISVGVSGPGVVKSALEDVQASPLTWWPKRSSARPSASPASDSWWPAKPRGGWACPLASSISPSPPTPAVGDSVAEILEEMGLEVCGTHGTTAALALLNDAVKKGGVMASSHVGGLSGAFIPVSEDIGMIRAAEKGALTLEQARGDDLRLLCRPRHDRRAGRHLGGDHFRHHRRRGGHRRHQQQDHRRAHHPRAGQKVGDSWSSAACWAARR